tara:strand:+ start:7291 stop:7611 length:321 start_codon:yes stop_codon:yes gene_type:complete
MPKFRKLPVVVDAVRITEQVEIETLEGTMVGNVGDWLITGIDGEKYPCKDEIFRKTYEPVRLTWETMPTGSFSVEGVDLSAYLTQKGSGGCCGGCRDESRNEEGDV